MAHTATVAPKALTEDIDQKTDLPSQPKSSHHHHDDGDGWTLRSIFIKFFNFFVVIAKCFLCLIGMLVFSPSLVLAIFVVWLMAGIQWEVNKSGFGLFCEALKNLFSPTRSYLEKELNKKLNLLLERNAISANSFIVRFYFSPMCTAPNKATPKEKITTLREELIKFIIQQLEPQGDGDQPCVFSDDIFDRSKLPSDEIAFLEHLTRNKWKRWSWFLFFAALSLAGGISTGLAALSSIYGAIDFLVIAKPALGAVLVAVPGGVWVLIAALAALGFSFLLYQTFSHLYEKFEELGWIDGIKNYFGKRQVEPVWQYCFRLLGIVIAIGLVVFAIWGTFGTWWGSAKDGAERFDGIATSSAALIRTITVLAMIVPTFIFLLVNSVEAVNKLFAADWAGLTDGFGKELKDAWSVEVRASLNAHPVLFFVAFLWVPALLRFLNPFRIIGAIIRNLTIIGIFLGHIATEGMMGDHPDPALAGGINDAVFGATATAADGLADFNYMGFVQPHEEFRFGKKTDGHSHYSALIMWPLKILAAMVWCLEWIAVAWDWCFGSVAMLSCVSWDASCKKMNPEGNYKTMTSDGHDHHVKTREVSAPQVDSKMEKKSDKSSVADEEQACELVFGKITKPMPLVAPDSPVLSGSTTPAKSDPAPGTSYWVISYYKTQEARSG